MNTIKIVITVLALMTTSSFADFTIKDLFISGGTEPITEGSTKGTHTDCI